MRRIETLAIVAGLAILVAACTNPGRLGRAVQRGAAIVGARVRSPVDPPRRRP